MTPRSCVCLWTVLLSCCALPGDTQALCGNNCSTQAVLTATTTSITLESPPNCSISTGGRNSSNGSISGLTSGAVHEVQLHCLNCCKPVATQPGRVLNLNATSTTSSVFVTWTEPPGKISSYRIDWTHENEPKHVNATEASKTITDLTAGTQYNITVTAVAEDNRTAGEGSTLLRYTKPNMVESLIVKGETTSSVYLNWTKPEGNNSFYRVKWTKGLNNRTDNVTETNLNVTNLTAGVKYSFTVQSVAGDNTTESEMMTISSYTKPEIVLNISVTEVTTSSMYLNWTKPEGNNSFYRVKWTKGLNNRTDNVTETNLNVTNLTAGVKYSFTVQSVAGDNTTESEMMTISSYTKPEIVLNLNLTEITTSSMYLNWTKPEGNNSFYRVKWTKGLNNRTDNVIETNLNVTNLTAGVKYSFTVQSVAGDNTTESEMMTISSYTKPEIVLNISVTEVTTSSMYLNWTKPEGNNSFYRVKWTKGLNNRTDNVTETNLNVTNLTAGVKYSFTVQSVAGDNTTESEMMTISSYTKPEIVLNLSVTEVTTSSMYLNWTKPEGNNSFYRVKWTKGLNNRTDNVIETNLNVTNLTAGVKYSFTVQSVAGDNTTESEMMTISSYTKPEIVLNLNLTEITTSSVYLNWTKPEGNNSFYRVKWTKGLNNRTDNVTETNLNVTNLTAGVKYSFTVQSVAGDNTTESEMKTISSYTKPEIVLNISVTEVTTSSVYLNWTKPEGNNSFYRVKWTKGLNNRTDNVTETNLNVTNLTAGVKYSFTVQSVAGDNTTESEMMTISSYTKPDRPGNVTVTHRGTDSLCITWTLSGGKTFFMVNISNDNLAYLNVSRTNDSSANFTDLLPGRIFNVTVTAVAGNLETVSNMSSFATMPTPPGPIHVADRTNSSIQLAWSGPESMEGAPDVRFNIAYQHQGGEMQRTDTTDNDTKLSSLSSGTAYSIYITTTGPQNLNSTAVNISSFTLPNPVLNLVARADSTTSVIVYWSEPLGVQLYYKYLVQVFNGTEALVKSTTVSDNGTLVSELEPGSEYKIRVTTVAESGINSAVEETLSSTMPSPVANLSVAHVNTTSMELQWARQNDHKPSTIYQVEASRDGLMVHTDSTQNETYTFYNLNPGTPYTFQVFAVLEGVQSSKENRLFYTEPEAVSLITATGGTTDLSVSWELVSGQVSSYAVQLDGGENPQNRTGLSNETTSTRFSGLKPGVDYCVVLVTKSGPHAIKSLPVCNATFPNPPSPITVQSQTGTSINFTWTFPLDMNPDQCNFSVTTVNGSFLKSNNWYLLDDLQSGSPYNISVVTVGVRKYESTEETALNYTRPYSVTNLTATKITTDTVTLEWNQPEAKSYYSFLVQSTDILRTVLSPNVTITDLQSGSNFSFTVTTRTADGTEAEPVTVSYFTRPHPVQQLTAESLNTTAVRLNWSKPLQYKDYYLYWVEVTGCSYQNKNLTEETVEISDLNPGTNCTFCVSVEAEGFKGEKMCTSDYTKPETVQPTVSGRSNDSIQVSWTKPEGNVDKYQVNLNRSSSDSNGSMQLTYIELNSNSTGYVFENLSPGRLYSAMVIVHSGPFSAPSELKENATFPNPPGPITILNKTTGSIDFRWAEAPLMEGATFFYQLTLTQLPEGKITDIRTNTTTRTFDSLPSGTSFIISVSTQGIMDFESLKVHENVTTRPLSVQSLTTTAGDTRIRVDWMKPEESKDGYRYNVSWEGPDGAFGSRIIVNDIKYTVDELVPGSRYNISVTTETSDGTQAEPQRSSNCTRASPVKNMMCRGPNEDNARISLSWLKPNGQSSGFRVSVNDTEIQNTSTCCSRNVSNLLHNTEYKITVETLSCGQDSTPEILNCTTGITNPPIPSDYQSKVKTVAQGHNKFSISINSSLFDPVKGPITHVGVLVTKSLSGVCPNCTKYLMKTYNDFKDGTAQVYLATVTELQRSRSSQELSIHVGDNAQWEGYTNGALEAQTNYRYAIVLFTRLTVQNHLVVVGMSLVSFTNFTFTASLSGDPAIIGIAVGSTLGIFCILFIILIGFIIFWKRMSKKESPEIQIHSLRAKVSVPVRVEDYEAYFMKQRADSNCGFAEEFEDLKTVGTAQEKMQALSLENKPKNRYTNVLPYDSSRVKLSIIRGSPSDDYINANYMPGYNSRKEFIAAQGPLPATVNDFWRMIWEKNVQTLVMLTRCNEQGRIKCEQYWSPGTKHFGDFTVTTASEIPLEDWTIRDFTIKNVKTAETRSVCHFHFTAWPDHGVPETTELLITFRHLVREHMNQYSRHSPTVVHCSAGVGRTGTFIAIDHLIFQFERENIVDVYGIVHGLRMHRALMVQTEDQYVFLNQCALDIIRSRTGTNVDLIYQNAAALSIYENLEPHRACFKS